MNVQAIAIQFADRLNRERGLTEEETNMLCAVIDAKSPECRRLWTQRDDRELSRLARKLPRMSAPAIAIKVGRTAKAVEHRLHILKGRG